MGTFIYLINGSNFFKHGLEIIGDLNEMSRVKTCCFGTTEERVQYNKLLYAIYQLLCVSYTVLKRRNDYLNKCNTFVDRKSE
jgi:hypothetical protein